MQFDLMTGNEQTLDNSPNGLTIRRFFQIRDALPWGGGQDHFDYVAAQAIAFIRTSYPTYGTPMGTLYWNTIQIRENAYVQNYGLEVTYGKNPREVGLYQVQYDDAGGTANVKSGEVVGAWGPNAPADLIGKAAVIGLDVKGEQATGVDIPISSPKVTVMFRHSQGSLTQAYLKSISALIGHMNADAFIGYAAGEVMFRGTNATATAVETTASYHFDISFNEVNLNIGGIVIANKKGWELVDTVWKSEVLNGKPATVADYLVTTLPGGLKPKAYVPVFGWGGP